MGGSNEIDEGSWEEQRTSWKENSSCWEGHTMDSQSMKREGELGYVGESCSPFHYCCSLPPRDYRVGDVADDAGVEVVDSRMDS